MKRKPRIFIGFLAAAITFGTLMATVGPRHHRHHKCHHHAQQDSSFEKSKTTKL